MFNMQCSSIEFKCITFLFVFACDKQNKCRKDAFVTMLHDSWFDGSTGKEMNNNILVDVKK